MTASASPTPHHVVAIPRQAPLHNVYSCMTFFVREHPDLRAAIVSAERIYASMSQDLNSESRAPDESRKD